MDVPRTSYMHLVLTLPLDGIIIDHFCSVLVLELFLFEKLNTKSTEFNYQSNALCWLFVKLKEKILSWTGN